MKNESVILDRINEFKQNIVTIKDREKKELEKHYSMRNFPFLFFCNREQSVYEFAIEQLEWFLSEKEKL